MIKVAVKVLPKKEVLDVQGRAIAETLKRKGHALADCRYGKWILLSLKTTSKKKALESAEEMARSILCNSLIEDYELEILSSSKSK